MLRFLLVDDHPLVRRGLTQALGDEFPGASVVEVADGAAALAAWQEGDWHLALLDISMPGRGGLEVLQQMRAARPATPILMVSALAESAYAQRCLRLGAAGFVAKETAVEDLVAAVRTALAGRRYVSPRFAEALANDVADGRSTGDHGSLSPREFDVAMRLARGQPVGTIARATHLSVKTVSTYRARVFQKMGWRTNADATRYAVREGLIDEQG